MDLGLWTYQPARWVASVSPADTLCRMFALVLITSAVAFSAPSDGGVQRVELVNGYYLYARPAELKPDIPLPLIFCLHGTETNAGDILRFWRSLSADLPFVLVAPQGSRAGWRASDLPLLREALGHVRRNVVFDPRRVLLTGHSAGGAMAFRLLYVEGFPATAAAVTANYLPPNITSEQARKRADVPVFYAVGVRDPNRTRMRQGAALLREAGVQLTMRRPRIGHVLDRGVGQEALGWFEQLCREHIQSWIEQACDYKGSPGSTGLLAVGLERVLDNSPAHFPDQIPQVRQALGRLEAPGRRMLTQAHELSELHKYAEAYGLYVRVERDYQPALLAEAARNCRLKLERDPRAAADIAAPRREQEAKALLLWASIEQALANSDQKTARHACRELLARYPHSSKAGAARRLLEDFQPDGN